MLDLYAGVWDGRPLGAGDYVSCADEKTSIQARCRCHPTLPLGKARAMRIEHDYDRGGALASLAAWDVHRGRVTGRCEDSTGIAPFARLAAQVMTTEPYASADRVFWITDNGASHRGAAAAERMASTWPSAQLIHLPAHASWLDQAEIYFSVIQRKVLTPNDFTGLDQIRDRLAAFEARYNAIARPFTWKFTPTDLGDLLRRIDAHDKPHALWQPDYHEPPTNLRARPVSERRRHIARRAYRHRSRSVMTCEHWRCQLKLGSGTHIVNVTMLLGSRLP